MLDKKEFLAGLNMLVKLNSLDINKERIETIYNYLSKMDTDTYIMAVNLIIDNQIEIKQNASIVDIINKYAKTSKIQKNNNFLIQFPNKEAFNKARLEDDPTLKNDEKTKIYSYAMWNFLAHNKFKTFKKSLEYVKLSKRENKDNKNVNYNSANR